MNTTTSTRKVNPDFLAEEQSSFRSAICLRVGIGPKRTTPGFDDPDEAGQAIHDALAAYDLPDPTSLIARAHEFTAVWTFDAPVREADLITLTQALGKALDASSALRGWALSTGRVSERDLVSEREFKVALSEFLPSSYARGGER